MTIEAVAETAQPFLTALRGVLRAAFPAADYPPINDRNVADMTYDMAVAYAVGCRFASNLDSNRDLAGIFATINATLAQMGLRLIQMTDGQYRAPSGLSDPNPTPSGPSGRKAPHRLPDRRKVVLLRTISRTPPLCRRRPQSRQSIGRRDFPSVGLPICVGGDRFKSRDVRCRISERLGQTDATFGHGS